MGGQIKHGHAKRGAITATYNVWRGMRRRCDAPRTRDYHLYGGRGIKVCKRWLFSFENFISDMGKKPEGLSLDRFPDNNGDYKPSNCRWATPTQQQRNGRNAKKISFHGKTLCHREWEELLGLGLGVVHARLKNGWSLERTLTTKLKGRAK